MQQYLKYNLNIKIILILEILGVKFSDLSLLKDMKDKIDLIKILNSTRTIHDNITDRIAQGTKLYNPLDDIQEYIPKRV